MVGLMIAIIIANIILYKTNKKLSKSQMLHIWLFTTVFQMTFDIYVSLKFQSYWYFTKSIDWQTLPVYTLLVPPVNIIFLNFYPWKAPLSKRILYLICWNLGILIYESITLLPEPWGYFHYGWWTIWHSVVINPILFFILLKYYKWICNLEKKPVMNKA